MSNANAAEIITGTEPTLQGQTELLRIGRHERMRKYFAERPKETIRIRKEDGEQFVQINGYPFQIQAGVPVKVPVDVADLLRNAEII
jgi:hypothetical protein